MSTLTSNYNFVKPELSDPADITALSENWDKIDTELKKKLDTTGGKLTGSLMIDDSDGIGLVKRRVINDVPYKALFNLRRLSNEPCPTIELTDDNDNEIRKIVLSPVASGGPYVKENDTMYHFYGEHNKPSGSYTGNGSAASRTINVGGIGSVIAIFAVNFLAVIAPYGGIMVNTEAGTIKNVSSGDAKYENGVLTIANDTEKINYNGAIYYYQVL